MRVILLIISWQIICGFTMALETSKVNKWVEGHLPVNLSRQILTQADSVFKTRQYDEAATLYLRTLKAAEDEGDIDVQTESMAQIARVFLINNNLDSGRIWLEKASAIADSNNALGWSRYMGVKGRLLWQEDKKPEATQLFMEQYEYCSKHNLYERAIDAAHMVAITGDHEQQIEWGKKGIKEAEEGQIIGWLGPLWNNLGATYEEMHKYDSSLEAYLKAREYHYQTGTESNKMIADWAVGHAYLNLKDYGKAREWLTPLVDWCQRLGDKEFLGLTYRDLGETYYNENRCDKALRNLEMAESLLREVGMPEWDTAGFEKLIQLIADCKKKTGND